MKAASSKRNLNKLKWIYLELQHFELSTWNVTSGKRPGSSRADFSFAGFCFHLCFLPRFNTFKLDWITEARDRTLAPESAPYAPVGVCLIVNLVTTQDPSWQVLWWVMTQTETCWRDRSPCWYLVPLQTHSDLPKPHSEHPKHESTVGWAYTRQLFLSKSYLKQLIALWCMEAESFSLWTMAHSCGPDGSWVCQDHDPFIPGAARASGLLAFRH